MNKHLYIVTNPMTPLNQSSEVTTSKFVRTVRGCYETVTVIGGNVTLEKDLEDIQKVTFRYEKKRNKIKKLQGQYSLQKKIVKYIEQNVKYGDHIIFWLGDKMILPFLRAKRLSDHLGYFVYGNLATEGDDSLFMKLSAGLVIYMANHADKVFVESAAVKDGWGGRLKKTVYELHLYTDTIEFNPIGNRQKIIGMLCRLAGVKHVVESIHAFYEIHQIYPEWKLEMIGSGIQQEECQNLIDELEANSYIKLYGWVGHETVRKITDRWQFNMLTSDHEGLPNSMIEMMGKGIPIIATFVGGIPDLLVDGVNGFKLNGTTVEDIKKGLQKAITCGNYEELSVEAFKTTSTKYSLEGAMKDATLELLYW